MIVWNGIEAILPQHYAVFGVQYWIDPDDYIPPESNWENITNFMTYMHDFVDAVHSAEGFIIFAHPPFNPYPGRIPAYKIDGYEIGNGAVPNDFRWEDALTLDTLKTGVSDSHGDVPSTPPYTIIFYKKSDGFSTSTLKDSISNMLVAAYVPYYENGSRWFSSSANAQNLLDCWDKQSDTITITSPIIIDTTEEDPIIIFFHNNWIIIMLTITISISFLILRYKIPSSKIKFSHY